jgi:hypothetical protein
VSAQGNVFLSGLHIRNIRLSTMEPTMNRPAILVLLTMSWPAFAGLGDAATPITADQATGTTVVRRAVPARNYTVQDIQAADGTTVREYVAPDGKVFAVTWSGPVMPDLEQLFGAHFQSYRGEVQSRRPGRGPLRIDRGDLVVESGGHMRAFRGRAYLPQQLPTGVTADEIR